MRTHSGQVARSQPKTGVRSTGSGMHPRRRWPHPACGALLLLGLLGNGSVAGAVTIHDESLDGDLTSGQTFAIVGAGEYTWNGTAGQTGPFGFADDDGWTAIIASGLQVDGIRWQITSYSAAPTGRVSSVIRSGGSFFVLHTAQAIEDITDSGFTVIDPTLPGTGGQYEFNVRQDAPWAAFAWAWTLTVGESPGTCGDGFTDPGEDCDGGACCAADCRYESATATCRPAAGTCDAPEFCTGASALCPTDTVEPAGTACRPSIDLACDPKEVCDGVAIACPADNVVPDGAACDDGDGATIGETCTGGVCGCLGPDLDGDHIADVCDPEDAPLSIHKAVAWPTRSKLGRIRAKGSFQTSSDDILDPSDGFTLSVTDGGNMRETAALLPEQCETKQTGAIRCRDGRNARVSFSPIGKPPGGYKFKLLLQKRDFDKPQAGPLEVTITQADSIDRRGRARVCRESSASLSCRP